jgi:HEAT repeat protein
MYKAFINIMYCIRRITVISILLFLSLSPAVSCAGRLAINSGQVEKDRQLRNAEKLYQSRYWIDRRNAVLTASDYISPRSFNLLVKGASDTHNRVRIEAIKALGSYNDSASFQILAESCRSDDVMVKYYSLVSLMSLNDSKAAPLYIEGLRHADWMIREASIQGLLKINDETVKKYSVDYTLMSLQDTNENVRITAMANNRVKDVRIGGKLCEEIVKNADGKKITYLSEVLKALNGYKIDDKTKNILVGFLTHQNNDLRILALRVLKSSGEAQRREVN